MAAYCQGITSGPTKEEGPWWKIQLFSAVTFPPRSSHMELNPPFISPTSRECVARGEGVLKGWWLRGGLGGGVTWVVR